MIQFFNILRNAKNIQNLNFVVITLYLRYIQRKIKYYVIQIMAKGNIRHVMVEIGMQTIAIRNVFAI